MSTYNFYLDSVNGSSSNSGDTINSPLSNFVDLIDKLTESDSTYNIYLGNGEYVWDTNQWSGSIQIALQTLTNCNINVIGKFKNTTVNMGYYSYFMQCGNTNNIMFCDVVINLIENHNSHASSSKSVIFNNCVFITYSTKPIATMDVVRTANYCLFATTGVFSFSGVTMNYSYGNYRRDRGTINNSVIGTQWDSSTYEITDTSVDTNVIGLFAESEYAWMDYTIASGIKINLMASHKVPATSSDKFNTIINIAENGNMYTYKMTGERVDLAVNSVTDTILSGTLSTTTTYTLSKGIDNYSFISIVSVDANNVVKTSVYNVDLIKSLFGTTNSLENIHETGSIKYSFVDNTTFSIDTISENISITNIYGTK